MKEQHLLSYFIYKLEKLQVSDGFFVQLNFCVLLLFFIACTGTTSDEGTSPSPFWVDPISFEANVNGGYSTNTLTGDIILPIVLLNDTIKTGIPIPIKGKLIHPDSIIKPKTIKITAPTNQFNVRANIHKIPKNLTTINVNQDSLHIVSIPLIERDDNSHYLVKRSGDTIPTGVPLTIIGKKVESFLPKSILASPPKFKDNAIYNIQFLDKDQSMISSFINTIMEDRKGNIWIGTNDGLSRYDGISFTHFTKKEGLSDNFIYSIKEDLDGNIWIGTMGGLNFYDGASFTHFTEKEGFLDNWVKSILEDRDGNLWFGTGEGVSRYQPINGSKEGVFTHFTEKEGFTTNPIISISECRDGNIWFGTWGGAIRYTPKKGLQEENFSHFTKKVGFFNSDFLFGSIKEDRNGNVWFGTGRNGVIRYEPHKDGLSGAFTHFTEKEGLLNNSVYSIIEDLYGKIWFGTRGGICQFQPLNSEQQGAFIHLTENEGFSSKSIMSIIEASEGNIWFATQGDGVGRYDGKSFTHFFGGENVLIKNINPITEDRDGNIWFGSFENGVFQYVQPKDGQPEFFNHFNEKEEFFGKLIYAITQDREGNLWFGTNAGATRYKPPNNGEAGTFTHYTEKEGLSSNEVFSIMEDRNGILWFGTRKGVIRYIQPIGGKNGIFTHFTPSAGFNALFVRAIMEARDGNIWFGTSTGVIRYVPQKEGFDGIITQFTEREGLANNLVFSINEDNDGNLWFGTIAGVSRYKPSKGSQVGTFSHLTNKEGLSDNKVGSIIKDLEENLWLSTGYGLNYLTFNKVDGSFSNQDKELKNLKIQAFYRNDGLKGMDFKNETGFLDSKNRLWWGSDLGITMLDMNKFNKEKLAPIVNLRRVDINEEFIDYRNINDNTYKWISFEGVQPFENYPLKLILPYDQNHLTFHFSAIYWSAPHNVSYSYRMLGLNNNWSSATKDAKVDYRSLPYGTYTFQVRAIGKSHNWSDAFEYTFTISPPWYLSLWAYGIYALFMVGIVWRIHLIQKARTLRIEREKTKDKELAQAKEIEKAYGELGKAHQTLKSTQAQLIQSEKMASLGELTAGIAHEIQNPLNFVNNFSEVSSELLDEMSQELDKGDIDEAKFIANDIKQNLDKINHHGKRADAIVKGMLEHSRISSGEKVPTDINALAEEYLRLSYHGMRAKDKSFNADFVTDFDPTLPKINLVPQEIGRVLLNIINNAFQACVGKDLPGFVGEDKRNLEGLSPLVKVSTKNLGDKIEITISDNGPGIPDAIKSKIFQPFFTTKPTGQGTGLGLSLSYDIVKAHGGEIKVDSQPGLGTTFIILLPNH
jgi:ligand-binding sensor domain-containing protein/signal transduction histidine kinase